MPEPNDEQFEKYLKNFRPVDPELLCFGKKKDAAGANRRSALAAAAVACVAAVALVVIVRPRNIQPTINQEAPTISSNAQHNDMSTPALTKLALDDHAAFDEFTRERVQTQFPPMKSEQSTLRILAKE